jgi:hypothetical protein
MRCPFPVLTKMAQTSNAGREFRAHLEGMVYFRPRKCSTSCRKLLIGARSVPAGHLVNHVAKRWRSPHPARALATAKTTSGCWELDKPRAVASLACRIILILSAYCQGAALVLSK